MPKLQVTATPPNSARDPLERFKDSPFGRKRYRTIPGTEKQRSTLRRLQLSLQRAGTRIANVLAPKGTRMEPKFREALRDCSHRVGDLIGILSRPAPQDPDTIDQCVNACIEASVMLADLPGAADISAQAYLKARLAVHCHAMSVKQLIALQQGLNHAMTSAAVNIEEFLTMAVEAVNEQLGQCATLATQHLLKALAHSKADLRTPDVLRACMHRLDSALAAMPPGRGPRMSRVLDPELSKLSLEQLKRLGQQVQEARTQPGLSAELQLTLETVAKAVQAKCVLRLSTAMSAWKFSPDAQEYVNKIVTQLNKALESKDPKEIEFRLQSTQGPGAQLLNFYGVVGPNEDALELSKGMFKDICSQLIHDGKLGEDDLRDLFKALPAATQASLKAGQSIFTVGECKVNELLFEAILQKFQDLGSEFRQACDKFQAISPDSPDRLMQQAKQLCEVRNHWNALKAHQDGHSAVNLRINKADRTAFEQIKTAAAQLDLSRLDRDALSDSALHGLTQALSEFNITPDLSRLQAEIARRKQESEAPYLTALSRGLEQLSQGDTVNALTSLQEARHCSEHMADVHQALGARAIDVDDRRNITKHVTVDFFHTQSRETLERWFQALTAEQTQQWAEGLRSQGPADQAGPRVGYSVQQELQGWVATSLNDQLSAQQHMDPFTQQGVQRGLVVLAQRQIEQGMPVNLLDSAIRTDMAHTRYVVATPDQPDEPVDSPAALRNRLKPTPAQNQRLAHLAGADLWKPVQAALGSADRTPVRLPDGTPVSLEGAQTQTICRLSRNPDGSLSVQLDRVIFQPARAINLDTKATVPLDLKSSQVRLSITFKLAPDGSMSMEEPVSYDPHIALAQA